LTNKSLQVTGLEPAFDVARRIYDQAGKAVADLVALGAGALLYDVVGLLAGPGRRIGRGIPLEFNDHALPDGAVRHRDACNRQHHHHLSINRRHAAAKL